MVSIKLLMKAKKRLREVSGNASSANCRSSPATEVDCGLQAIGKFNL